MQFLLDHIAAAIMGATIFLMLVATNTLQQRATLEAANYYTLRQQELSFVEVLRRDMQNVTELLSTEEHADSLLFRFRSVVDPANPVETEVIYLREWVKHRDGAEIYKVTRYIDGQASGGSASVLTGWEIEARNDTGGSVANPADGRQIYVKMEIIAPFQEGQTIRRAQWEASFRPPLLQDNLYL